MSLPYSVRFFRIPSVSSGPSFAFSVDSAHVAVIKCITAVYGSFSSVSPWEGWIEWNADGTKLVRGFKPDAVEPNGFGGVFLWWGSWVVEPGEQIDIHQAQGSGDWQASGYLLSAV
jgi:hypothetical protein